MRELALSAVRANTDRMAVMVSASIARQVNGQSDASEAVTQLVGEELGMDLHQTLLLRQFSEVVASLILQVAPGNPFDLWQTLVAGIKDGAQYFE